MANRSNLKRWHVKNKKNKNEQNERTDSVDVEKNTKTTDIVKFISHSDAIKFTISMQWRREKEKIYVANI